MGARALLPMLSRSAEPEQVEFPDVCWTECWMLLSDEVKPIPKSLKTWCRLQDSNPWPPDYKSGALPTELSRPEAALASWHAERPALGVGEVGGKGGGVPQVGAVGRGA